MNEEDRKCLKIHGDISSSDESDSDQSKFEFDEQYEIYKPPPIQIDHEKHKIIVIHPNESSNDSSLNCSYSKSLEKSLQDDVQGDPVNNVSVDVQEPASNLHQNSTTKLSKGQRKRLNKALKTALLAAKTDSNEGAAENVKYNKNNLPFCRDQVTYETNFPLLGASRTNNILVNEAVTQHEPKKRKRKKKNPNNIPTDSNEVAAENFICNENKGPLSFSYQNTFKNYLQDDQTVSTENASVDVAELTSNLQQNGTTILSKRQRKRLKKALKAATSAAKIDSNEGSAENFKWDENVSDDTDTLNFSWANICKKLLEQHDAQGILKQNVAVTKSVPNLQENGTNKLSKGQKRRLKKALKATAKKDSQSAAENAKCNNSINLPFYSNQVTYEQKNPLILDTSKKILVNNETIKKHETKKKNTNNIPCEELSNCDDNCLGNILEHFRKISNQVSPNKPAAQVFQGIKTAQDALKSPLIIEDLSENRKYYYDNNYISFIPDTWAKFLSCYLNENSVDLFVRLQKLVSEGSSQNGPSIMTGASNLCKELLPISSETNVHLQGKIDKSRLEVVEDLTENRKYWYNGNNYSKFQLGSWRQFLDRYLHEGCDNLIDSVELRQKKYNLKQYKLNNHEFDAKSMKVIEAASSVYVPNQKRSQTQLHQLIIEDLTKNRRYLYNYTSTKFNSASWTNFQGHYLNDNVSTLISSRSENHFKSKKKIVSRDAENGNIISTNYLDVIWESYFSDFRSMLRSCIIFLILRQVVPWFLYFIICFIGYVILYGSDLIFLIGLLIYLCIQFVINS